jgi:hypothetical protein
LECTSQKVSFGFVNSFTDDRDVALITPRGAKIVHTTTNKPEDILMLTTANYNIDQNGNIDADVQIKSHVTQYTNHLATFDGLEPKKLEEKYLDYFSQINNLKVSGIEVKNNKAGKIYGKKLHVSAAKYLTINPDDSIIFTPNTFNRKKIKKLELLKLFLTKS